MSWFANISISLKLKLIIMATSSIALLLACAAFAAYDQISTRRFLIDDSSTDARIIATNVTAAVAFGDADAANEILSGLSIRPNVVRGRVYTANGQQFADYVRKDARDKSPEPQPQPNGGKLTLGYLLVSEPIILDGENVGFVCLVSDTEQLQGRLQRYIGIVALVLFGSLMIALLISSRLQKLISGPLVHLADTARAVSVEKDFSIRAEKGSQDETGLLIDGFNEMLGQIQIRDEQLQQRNNSLQAEIAKRHSIEQALREGDERYRAFVSESSEAIWRLEFERPCSTTLPEDEQLTHFFEQGYLAECNDVMARIHGRTCADETVGTRLAALMNPLDPETVNHLREFIRSSYRLVNAESRQVDNDGCDHYFLHNLSGTVEDGFLVRAWGVQREITESKQAEIRQAKLEAQLRQAQKMEAIGTLAGGIAHDFNNILGAIIGYTELMQLDLPEEQPTQGYLAEVLTAGNRARELVRQILTFSRQEEHERKPIHLQSVIDEALKLLRATLPSTIEIRKLVDSQAPMMLGDPTQIHQIIMNLGTNASHAMSERGGILEVGLTAVDVGYEFAQNHADLHEGRYLQLMISDTGCGMDREMLERVFEPFFTTKPPGAGTGLGLSVVHGVVRRHEGAIQVYSSPRKGTSFKLFFPVHEAGVQGSPLTKSTSIPKGNGERILFVDDEAQLATASKAMLEHLGYRVTTQTSSLEALAAFRAQSDQFDLVITDQTMPGLSGADLAELMLDIRPDLPVILATGYSTTINPERAKAIGIREMLLKPNTTKMLGEAIRRVLAIPAEVI